MSTDSRTTASPAVIVGRYRIITLIAHGGMGSLYLARDPAIDRTIALKLLQKGFDDEAARERFAREARAAGRLRHPNIVTVFDVGEHDHQPFIAMEYVPGETLDQLIRRRTPLSIANRLLILEDLCSGLHFAHTEGIIHRDIKPANVILDVAGTIKILDFGLAHAPDSGITKAGDQLGTLNYMSPEQVLGTHLDHRSDVYSVGALAYELLSYVRAFPGTVRDGTMYRILNGEPTPLAALIPDLDPEIATIVERAMRKEAEQRYQSLDDMREHFATVRRRLEGSEAAPAPDVDAPGAVESRSAVDDNPALTPMPVRHSRARALAGVARDSTPILREELASSAPTLASDPTAESVPRGTVGPSPSVTHAAARRTRRLVLAGAAAAVAMTLAASVYRYASSERPLTGAAAGSKPAEALTSPGSAPATTAVSTAGDASRSAAAIDARLEQIRATAARQVAAGERSQLLDTLSAGLVLDGGDVELNRLIDDLKRIARQTAVQARTKAARRGASQTESVEFRDGQARERGGETFDRAGDRAQAIRAFWAAAELYDRASGATAERIAPAVAATAPAPSPQTVPSVPKRDTPPAASDQQPPPAAPSHVPPISDKPPVTALPATPVPSTPAGVDVARDARAADIAAIQETLRRYADAYRNRDVTAVRRVLPSLSVQQVRGLEKDFSDYRSYTVEIADPQITLDHETAVAIGQVTRSFVTKNGVAGGHTVATTFRLRKIEGTWVIDRLESR
jgi:serine/threonine protein kinase